LSQVSVAPSSRHRSSNRRPKLRPGQGDATLVGILDGNRNPDIPRAAYQDLPSDPESRGSEPSCSGEDSGEDTKDTRGLSRDSSSSMSIDPPPPVSEDDPMGSLQVLAAGALGALAFTQPSVPAHSHDLPAAKAPDKDKMPPIAVATLDLQLPIRGDERGSMFVVPTGREQLYSPPRHAPAPSRRLDMNSPISPSSPTHGELPPLQMDSPKSDTNGHGPLPSIRSQLGDLKPFGESLIDKDHALRHTPSFSRSPPASLPRMSALPSNPNSLPLSPSNPYLRELSSPSHSHSTVGSLYYATNGTGHRPNPEYSSSSATETPSTDQSGSTPATSVAAADRMSIDELTHSSLSGGYVCSFSGCTAAPFQTQYLLNSHANVHSSARPHYCVVQGCPRSEGGKGFKRKNEMIRHGLVHDSPGYVCPFCPDKEHKYPRPDNLQRYVVRKACLGST